MDSISSFYKVILDVEVNEHLKGNLKVQVSQISMIVQSSVNKVIIVE